VQQLARVDLAESSARQERERPSTRSWGAVHVDSVIAALFLDCVDAERLAVLSETPREGAAA
jgi:hypothetical protein